MTFPGGTHDLWIRYWLAAGGIDPDKDIETIVVPPPQMVANMKVGTMDCFCVCEPWNLQLIHQNIGYTAITTGELWNKHPEKSLGMRAAFVDKNPKAANAILMAVMEAQQWCEKPENHAEVAAICAKRQWINCPVEDITDRVKGKFDYGIPGKVVEKLPHIMRYWNDFASYPFQSHDLWFLTEDIRWGKFEAGTDTKALIAKVNREDIWREAAKELSVPADQIPDIEVARQGDLLRRQGLRSGKSDGLPQEPADQARRGRLNDRAAGGRDPLRRPPSSQLEQDRNEHARSQDRDRGQLSHRAGQGAGARAEAKTPFATRALAPSQGASPATSCRRWSCSRSSSCVWELLCRKAGATLPPPSTRAEGHLGADRRSVLRSRRHRQGPVLAPVGEPAARRLRLRARRRSSASRSARWSASRSGRCAGSIRSSRCCAPCRRSPGCRSRSRRSATASRRRSS